MYTVFCVMLRFILSKMAVQRNKGHYYFSQDATVLTSRIPYFLCYTLHIYANFVAPMLLQVLIFGTSKLECALFIIARGLIICMFWIVFFLFFQTLFNNLFGNLLGNVNPGNPTTNAGSLLNQIINGPQRTAPRTSTRLNPSPPLASRPLTPRTILFCSIIILLTFLLVLLIIGAVLVFTLGKGLFVCWDVC